MNPKLKMRIGMLRAGLLPHLLDVISQRAWNFLPGDSTRFGPPRRWAEFADYRRIHGSGWQVIEPAGRLALTPLFHSPVPDFARSMIDEVAWPDLGLATITGARVLQEEGWVVGEGDTFLGEFSLRGNHPQSRVYHVMGVGPVRRLAGVTLNLASLYSNRNFYHWMIDAVARIDFFLRSGLRWSEVDHIILPQFRSATTAIIEAALDLPVGKVIRPDHYAQFLCDTLLQPSLPSCLFGCAPAAIRFHRNLLTPAKPLLGDQATRLYIPRRSNRRLTEEAELEGMLRKAGFVEADSGNFQHFRRQLASARLIVGIHGAALTNLVYCRPEARVLEIAPHEIIWQTFHALTASLKLDYGLLVGRSQKPRRHQYADGLTSNFTIPVGELRDGLDSLLSA